MIGIGRSIIGAFIGFFLVMGLYGQSFQQVHDPSDAVFHNGRWYIYTTGDGIFTMSKTSLTPTTGWRVEPRVFPSAFPAWITSYVSGFTGHFWAPHLTNNRVYYSCSSFGSKVSAIGMAEGPPGGPYVDKGMVVFSNRNTNQGNAIDPFVFDDYLIYGSWFDGIHMVRLGADGKPATTARTKVVDGGARDAEAAFMTQHGDYYYLWFNRGKCCDGLNSTYSIQVGRSNIITGPFKDKNGALLTSGGGTTVLSTSGRYIGPGGSGVTGNTLIWHFYDGNTANGAPRLMTGTISYIDGWPCVTPVFGDGGKHCNPAIPASIDLVSGNNYRVTPSHSIAMALDVANCGISVGTNVRQWEWINNDCQTWKLIYNGDDNWLITSNSAIDKALSVADTSHTDGANIDLQYFSQVSAHQQWQLKSLGRHLYAIKNSESGKCLAIADAGMQSGANLVQNTCNELLTSQQFFIMVPENIPISSSIHTNPASGSISVYPNPANKGQFTVEIEGRGHEPAELRLIDMAGRLIISQKIDGVYTTINTQPLKPGLYLVKVYGEEGVYSEKIIVK